MKIKLPLEVLGRLAPLLSWVEAAEDVRLPGRGHRRARRFEERPRAWLRRELPTYSRDTLDEILEQTEAPEDGWRPPPWWTAVWDDGTEKIGPYRHYDLAAMLGRLGQRYFDWTGSKLRVRVGLLEELHELAARFPAAHLIRHTHARAVSRGYLSARRARQLPERLSALHTESRSLRAVVERGLSEGHLHLWGVTSADEVWADHLLSRPASGRLSRFSSRERQLLRLGRAAMGALALAVLMARHRDSLFEEMLARRRPGSDAAGEEVSTPRAGRDVAETRDAAEVEGGSRGPRRSRRDRGVVDGVLPSWRLFYRFDRLYWCDRPAEQKWLSGELRQQFHEETGQILEHCRLLGRPADRLDSCQRILYRLDPALFPLVGTGSRLLAVRHVERRTGIRDRARWLERLHLEVQLQLIELDELIGRASGPDAARGEEHRGLLCELRDFLHQAFFRYLVCHTHHLQLATQQGQTTGLREFSEFYGARQRTLLSPEAAQQHAMVLDRLLETGSLELIEGRVSPPMRDLRELRPWVQHYADRPEIGARIRHLAAGEKAGVPRFGIVLHFKKQAPGGAPRSRQGFPAPRHGRLRAVVRREAYRLFRLLQQPHEVVPFIVGIDAAAQELAAPPEVFAPAFRFLLDFPIEVTSTSSIARRLGFEEEVLKLLEKRWLGLTYHVGEDFRHLLSGLRAIFEAIEFLHLRPGDRLGHALALALDPERWAAQAGYQAVLPKQEWLDTLVWVHHFLGTSHPAVGELELEDRIQHLGEEIYLADGPWGETAHPPPSGSPAAAGGQTGIGDLYAIPLTFHDAWRLRQLDPMLISCEAIKERRDPFPDRRPIRPEARRWLHVQREVMKQIQGDTGSRATYELLWRYWFDRDCRQRGRKIETVDMQPQIGLWLEVCRDAQKKLKKLVQGRQLVVEVNPTSNLRIGPLTSLEEHPIFDLTLDSEGRLSREVVTTVNTDDPGVFNTSLPHEYYLLGEILLRRNVPESRVMEWLEWLRKNGHEYTFARFLPDLDNPDLQRLLAKIRRSGGSLSEWLRGTRKSWLIRHREELEKEEGRRWTRLEQRIETLENEISRRPTVA
ncbi:MAG: hypothetical protein GY719_25160 [bacterium]|nr:hypothetical protein [bacterium]